MQQTNSQCCPDTMFTLTTPNPNNSQTASTCVSCLQGNVDCVCCRCFSLEEVERLCPCNAGLVERLGTMCVVVSLFAWRLDFEKSQDTVSEWLRRWTRNPLGSARRGSNPLGVGLCVFFMVPCQAMAIQRTYALIANRSENIKYRHQGDSNPCGQSPMDF